MTNAHQQGTHFAIWKIGLAIFIGIGVIVGLYFAFRYTIIADFRESQSNIEVTDTIAYGELLFQTRGCTGCHSHDGIGSVGDEGPDLTHIAQRSDEAQITESIINPNAVIADNCPEEACQANVMPNFGNILSDEQVSALVIFLTSDQ